MRSKTVSDNSYWVVVTGELCPSRSPVTNFNQRKTKRRITMKVSRHVASVVVVMAFAAIVTAGMLIKSPRVQAQSGGDSQESRIKRGFEIAPVPLSLEGKDRALVGLGSYLVNAVAAC